QNKAPKYIRRFRSRSLPIITYQNPTNRSHVFQHHIPNLKVNTTTTTASSSAHHHHHHQSKPKNSSNISLPPINLQSLKEIDLHEILKNPQLRHDILFDPQLQFRPNLDGERGRRKKTIIDKYWNEIEKECKQFFIPNNKSIRINSLPILFTTLRDILLSLLPYKDRSAVNEIMDIDLLIQQLNHGSFDFVNLAKWLGEVFKSHCAPMRDQWVSDMILKFVNAYETNSVEKLVQGLRMIFSILEAMKLDVANHQIRILRPVLTETAVDFEKDYFNQLINHCKIDINDSLKWFDKNVEKKKNSSSINHFLNDSNDLTSNSNLKILITSSIIDLLSCRNMATEFPSTLAFDHTRLVLLRADVRQLVCVQLCVVLYKQLLLNYSPSSNYRNESFKPSNINKVQEEILAIVTDDNGNVKWTRNVQAISLQLVKNATTNPLTNESVKLLPKSMIEFSCNWLIKQIQPSSEVYGLMEDKIFKELLKDIITNLEFENSLINSNPDQSNDSNKDSKKINSESNNIALRISTLVKFHWNVFGNYYTDYLKN
ncbi:T-complex 11, partial [Hyphopichia burtonii NRRL Y-1933]